MNLFKKLALLVAGAVALTGTAAATQTPPINVRGRVVMLSDTAISVRQADGKVTAMYLSPEWSVQVMRPIALTDIKPGSFVGAVESPLAGDVGQAHEVHVFLPGVRMGEGHAPWDRPAGAMITHGDIGSVTVTDKGHEFDLSFPGGRRHIVARPGTPVVLINNEGRENIRENVEVFILAWPQSDGRLRVDAVATGVGGVAPPL